MISSPKKKSTRKSVVSQVKKQFAAPVPVIKTAEERGIELSAEEEAKRLEQEKKVRYDKFLYDHCTILQFTYLDRRKKEVTCDRFTCYSDLQREIAHQNPGNKNMFMVQVNGEFIRYT
jgi:hypothetical protein